MTDFTPGPWHVTGSDENGAMIVHEKDVPDPTVARWPLFGATVEAVANARLIAAAPDLYKDVGDLLFIVEALNEGNASDMMWDKIDAAKERLAKIDA